MWKKFLISFIFISLFFPCFAYADLNAGSIRQDERMYMIMNNEKLFQVKQALDKQNINFKIEIVLNKETYIIKTDKKIKEIEQCLDKNSLTTKVAPIRKMNPQSDRRNPWRDEQVQFYGRWDLSETDINRDTFGLGHGFEKVRFLASESENTSTIAVLDTDFMINHAELEGKMLNNYSYNAVEDRKEIFLFPEDSHGTEVCSILVANKNNNVGGYGICTKTKILPIKVMRKDGYIYDEDIIKGLVYIENLLKTGQITNLHVINLSFGAWYSDELYKKWGIGEESSDPLYKQMKHMYNTYDIVFICSGGNGNKNNGFAYLDGFNIPSDYDCSVSVTANDCFGTNVCWSDANKYKDLTALGDDVIVASTESKTAISTVSGTSYSAPMVSGAVASLIQINPKLSARQAVKILEQTATKVSKSKKVNYRKNTGSAGIINAEKAAWKAIGYKKYWKGMNDCVKYKNLIYGYQVLSSKEKTVELICVAAYDKNLSNFIVPNKVKLKDNKIYKVVSYNTCPEIYGKVKKYTIGKNVRKIVCLPVYSDIPGNINEIIIKSKFLTKNSIKECLEGVDFVKKIIIKVSKNHNINQQYVEKYKKIFTKKNVGCKILKIVAA